MGQYAGALIYPAQIDVPDDGAPPTAAQVSTALRSLADRTAWLKDRDDRYLQMRLCNFDLPRTLNGAGLGQNAGFFSARRARWYLGAGNGKVYFTRNHGGSWVDPSPGALLVGIGMTGAFNNDPLSAQYGDGLLISSAGGAVTISYSHALDAFAGVAMPISPTSYSGVLHDPVTDKWIVFGAGGGAAKVQNAPTATNIFVDRSAAMPAASTFATSPCHNGAGTIVCIRSASAFATSFDGGNTWAATPMGAVTLTGVCWIPGRSEFLATTLTGLTYASADGLVWAARSLAAIPFTTIRSLVAIDSVVLGIFVPTVIPGPVTPTEGGICYSLDGGITWGIAGPVAGGDVSTPHGLLAASDDAVLFSDGWDGLGNWDAFSFCRNIRLAARASAT